MKPEWRRGHEGFRDEFEERAERDREARDREIEHIGERRLGRDLGILLAGIGIGTAIALLVAPASGDDVRYALNRRYRKAAKRIGRHKAHFGDRAEDLFDLVNDLRQRGPKIFSSRRGDFVRPRA